MLAKLLELGMGRSHVGVALRALKVETLTGCTASLRETADLTPPRLHTIDPGRFLYIDLLSGATIHASF